MRTGPGPLLLITSLVLSACASRPKVEPAPSPAPTASTERPTAPAEEALLSVPAVNGAGVVVTCDKKSDHRTLDLRSRGEGCELAYTKNGPSAVVASAQRGTKRCETALEKLKGKLTAAGFACR